MDLEILVENFILRYGLISIFIVVALEYANAPLPSEIVLPFAGILATEHNMSIYSVISVSILGGIIGSLTNYYLGYKFGNPLLYKIKEKYPRTKKAIKESNKYMEKYDRYAVMVSRIVPIARTFISIVAGVTRMNVFSFIFYSTIGISIWNIFLIFIGYIIGDNMDKIAIILSNYTKLVLVTLIFVLIVGFIIYYKRKRENISEVIEDEEI